MAKIIFLPVCSECGAKIEKPVYVDIDWESYRYDDDSPYMHGEYAIRPRRCPVCRNEFDAILFPERLPFTGYSKEILES